MGSVMGFVPTEDEASFIAIAHEGRTEEALNAIVAEMKRDVYKRQLFILDNSSQYYSPLNLPIRYRQIHYIQLIINNYSRYNIQYILLSHKYNG